MTDGENAAFSAGCTCACVLIALVTACMLLGRWLLP